MSWVGQFAAGLVEAAWLCAAVLVPLFFNRLAEKGFEPEKFALLRYMAVLAAAGSLLVWLEERSRHQIGKPGFIKGLFRSAFFIPLATLTAAYFVSSIFSVEPRNSWLGSYENAQGTLSFFACLVLFAVVARHLRRAEQLQTFVTVAIAASIPICLYGFIQRMQLDPVGFNRLANRVFSTQGHPIFLAAYLGMVMPLTLWRLFNLISAWRQTHEKQVGKTIALFFYGATALIQALAILYTESRGALLASVGALALFGIYLAVWYDRRRWLIIPTVGAGVVFGMVFLISAGAGPFKTLQHIPGLGRFAEMSVASHAGTSGRHALWAQAPQLMLSSNPMPYPDGNADRFHSIRPFVGYGPETLGGVLAHKYTFPDANPVLENRFHNLTWDLWAGIGGLGVIAFFWFIASLYFHAYKSLGWVQTRKKTMVFVACAAGMAIGGAAIFSVAFGAGYAGLGLQIGLAAGLGAYPFCSGLLSAGNPTNMESSRATLILALLAALAAHIVETGFAFPVAASTTLFWLFAGAILALCGLDGFFPSLSFADSTAATNTPNQPQQAKRGKFTQPGQRVTTRALFEQAITPTIIASIMLCSLLFSFVLIYSRRPMSAMTLLSRALTELESGRNDVFVLPILLMAAWLAPILALAMNNVLAGKRWMARSFLALSFSAVIAAIYALFKGWSLAKIGVFPGRGVSQQVILAQSIGYESVYLFFLIVLTVLLFALGWGCCPEVFQVQKPSHLLFAAGILGLFAAGAIAWLAGFRLTRANVCYQWGEVLVSQGLREEAVPVYERAIRLDPGVFIYRSKLARTLREQAETSSDFILSEKLFRQSELIYLEAQKLSILNRSHYHLGELYLEWAFQETHPPTRHELSEKARAAFARALVFEPKTEFVWVQAAVVDMLLLKQEAAGEEKLRHAWSLPLAGKLIEFGEYYTHKSRASRHPELKTFYARQAITYYNMAATNAALPRIQRYTGYMASGELNLTLGNPQQAQTAFAAAAEFASQEDVWMVEEALARASIAMKDKTAATQHIQRAMQSAPVYQQQTLKKLLEQAQLLP